jgi:hypothetical protein
LKPLFEKFEAISQKIKMYDQLVLKMAKEKYPETRALSQVKRVGTMMALTSELRKQAKRVCGSVAACDRMSTERHWEAASSPCRRFSRVLQGQNENAFSLT